tara:strand:+ start:19966 stop:20580 length:615 start_codon:yes stop_codon:yes gene_type:complete
MNDTNTSKKRPWTLIILFLVFAVPFAMAWYYYQTQDQREFKLMHHGDLIRPAKSIQQLSFTDATNNEKFIGKSLNGKWWVFYVAPDKCLEECHDNLYNIKQMITALGKNSNRVSSMFISLPDCQKQACEGYVLEHYPDMKRAELSLSAFEDLFQETSQPLERERVGEIYLCDPKGYVMMRYSGEAAHQDILKDLKRLLKYSKVG